MLKMRPAFDGKGKSQRINLMSFISALLTSLVLVYLGLIIIAATFANSLIFPAPPSSYGSEREPLFLKTDKGERIACFHLPNKEARYTILHSHGNGEDIGMVLSWARDLQKMGYAVFLYDYPGYGMSSGSPDEASTKRAIETAWHYLISAKGLSPHQIILHGRSVGGGPTLLLAREVEPAAVILESTFLSTFRVMTRYRILPWDVFDNSKAIRQLQAPLLMMHGKMDRTVPFHHAERLYALAPQPKSKWWHEQAGHNDLVYKGGESYWEVLKNFTENLAKSEP